MSKDFDFTMDDFTEQLDYDELEHASQIRMVQSQVLEDLQRVRESNERFQPGEFTPEKVSERIVWADPDFVERLEHGEASFAEELFSYAAAAGINLEIHVSSVYDQ